MLLCSSEVVSDRQPRGVQSGLKSKTVLGQPHFTPASQSNSEPLCKSLCQVLLDSGE